MTGPCLDAPFLQATRSAQNTNGAKKDSIFLSHCVYSEVFRHTVMNFSWSRHNSMATGSPISSIFSGACRVRGLYTVDALVHHHLRSASVAFFAFSDDPNTCCNSKLLRPAMSSW